MLDTKEIISVKLPNGWGEYLDNECKKEYFQNLIKFIRDDRKLYNIYPPPQLYFNALKQCKFDDVKIVIIGQDPYHGDGQANGLSFSVNDNINIPPSLRNIFTEIHNDLGIMPIKSGNLERWARQGVLLLNATLTVRANMAASHQNKGWEIFTDSIIKLISDNRKNIVFMLWGSYAQKKGSIIDDKKHLILSSVHPSPLSAHRGFFGCKHFSSANEYLQKNNIDTINWL